MIIFFLKSKNHELIHIVYDALGKDEFNQFISESISKLCTMIKPKIPQRPQTLYDEDYQNLAIMHGCAGIRSSELENLQISGESQAVNGNFGNNSLSILASTALVRRNSIESPFNMHELILARARIALIEQINRPGLNLNCSNIIRGMQLVNNEQQECTSQISTANSSTTSDSSTVSKYKSSSIIEKSFSEVVCN